MATQTLAEVVGRIIRQMEDTTAEDLIIMREDLQVLTHAVLVGILCKEFAKEVKDGNALNNSAV